MTIFGDLKKEIDKGREGRNKGLSMGLPKLESIIDGITQSTYYLILSSSGSGKSSFCLYSCVYKPLMEHLDDDDFKVLMVTLEMSPISLYVKLLSIYIYEKYGRELSYKEILSRKRGYTLKDEDYKMLMDCEEWIEKVDRHIEFYDKNVNANAIYALVTQRLEKVGRFVETETRKTYIPNNPRLIYLIIIDHIGLIKPQSGRTLKQEMDLASSYLVWFREVCGVSPIVIQQANRDHTSAERIKAGGTAFKMSDSKDSGNTVNDCNIMLAIFDPYKDGIRSYKGYNVAGLHGRFRSCQVLKNRFGESDVEVALGFYGHINYFCELPYPSEIIDYTPLVNPPKLL